MPSEVLKDTPEAPHPGSVIFDALKQQALDAGKKTFTFLGRVVDAQSGETWKDVIDRIPIQEMEAAGGTMAMLKLQAAKVTEKALERVKYGGEDFAGAGGTMASQLKGGGSSVSERIKAQRARTLKQTIDMMTQSKGSTLLQELTAARRRGPNEGQSGY